MAAEDFNDQFSADGRLCLWLTHHAQEQERHSVMVNQHVNDLLWTPGLTSREDVLDVRFGQLTKQIAYTNPASAWA